MRSHTLPTLALAAVLAACGAESASTPATTIETPAETPAAIAVEHPTQAVNDHVTPAAALPSLVYYRIAKH
jgi:hypothetical protein